LYWSSDVAFRSGPERVIDFAALGTQWTIRSSNSYRDSRAAERLGAAAQLLLVELADDDLCLLEAEIEVGVRVPDEGDQEERSMSVEPDGTRRWTVTLAPVDPEASPQAAQELLQEAMSVLSAILLDISLLPQEAYFAATERAFERGLGHKLAIGRPYDEMAEVVTESRYDAAVRRGKPPFPGGPQPTGHPELRWQDGPGPTYDRARAEEMLANRYRRLPQLIPRTLERLRGDEAFSRLLVELRERDWLDWHVLTALANISINRRLAARGLNTREAIAAADSQAQIREITEKPEQPGDPVISRSELTFAALEAGRRYGVLALARNWDLAVRGPLRSFEAYEQLLTARYGYWRDDVPHDDPFSDSEVTS
jgi:hypothetical protein